MTAGAHESGGGFGKSAGVVAARGIAVTALAVLVGVLLMVKGLNETDSALAAEPTSTSTQDGATDVDSDEGVDDGAAVEDDSTTDDGQDPADTVDDSTGTDDGTTIEPDPAEVAGPRPPAEVTVLVLNGAALNKVAARGTTKIAEAGYTTATPTNADSPAASLILYLEGYEADAIAVAAVFGLDPAGHVAPFDPATSPVADIADAQVIVRIGNDGLISV